MTQGLFSLRPEPNIDLSHKLLPRSPTMAFSSDSILHMAFDSRKNGVFFGNVLIVQNERI